MRHAVVLAGGQGTRLWPLSTAARPKQLVPLADGRSLLDLALERGRLVAGERVWLATGRSLVEAAPRGLGVAPERLVVEPSGRDTLAAVCLAMRAVAAEDPDAVVAVLTADHVIEPAEVLAAALDTGFAAAEADPRALVTFGVVPDAPATGYGWLELDPQAAAGAARPLRAFREKPRLADAQRMLAAGPGAFLWNSGMFVWRAAALLAAAEAFAPRTAAATAPHGPDSLDTAPHGTASLDTAAWDALPKLSVDHGVMEPAAAPGSGFRVLAVPLAARWLDVGSWPAYAETTARDAAGNATAARLVALDAAGNVAVAEDPDHVVALLGVEGLVVVATPGATLVCRADDAQRVKQLQALVAERAPDRA